MTLHTHIATILTPIHIKTYISLASSNRSGYILHISLNSSYPITDTFDQ